MPGSHIVLLPDIQRSRVTAELDRLEDSVEHYRVAISAEREMQFLFREFSGDTRVEVTVTLPHGYPNKAPVVTADPIEGLSAPVAERGVVPLRRSGGVEPG